ncbi:MAG: hypothetical protein KTR13_00830 [Saprospiraceae bacterium]|nr:hypothetical protein [Saprospiraceae bacterium]
MQNIVNQIVRNLSIFLFSILSLVTQAQDSTSTVVYHFKVNEMITSATHRSVKKSLEAAKDVNADYIVMELNTYGGLVDAADSIRTTLMKSKIPTISFINNNAASAGALISIACDSIYMAEGANMGAATVVDGEGRQAPDKYQSYMRSTMRSTAEAKGRDPLIAEAMVDDRVYIPNIIDSGKVLTFTTSEAIANNYCEGKANALTEVIETHLGLTDYTVEAYTPTFLDRVFNILLNPAVSSILMLIMIGGIYFELQTPGVGFPIAAAIIAAILYFAPLYLEGLAENWEIALFVVGLLLLAAEVFVIPGFGVAGVLGILAMLVSLTLSLIDNVEFKDGGPIDLGIFSGPLTRVALTLLAATALFFWLSGKMVKRRKLAGGMVLDSAISKEDGFTVFEEKLSGLVGLEGEVVNELRPAGRVEIDGEIYAAMSESQWVSRGETVKVVRTDVNNLVVRKVRD